LEHRIVAAARDGDRIVSVDAVQARGGHERRFKGAIFVDASGVAMLGVLVGAETLFGREARSEYNEPYAPDTADNMHHGNTLFFRTRMADHPVSFPDVPWATEVSKDYANLSGQLVRPGLENGPGPQAGANPSSSSSTMDKILFRQPTSGSTASGSIPTCRVNWFAII
jgi:hypothetical protein